MAEATGSITESTFQYIDTSEAVVTENFTDKKQSLFSGLITEAYVDGSYLS